MRMYFASLFVSDEDKAVEFYTNKLGFELVNDFPTPFGGRFLMFAPPGGGANIVMTKPVPGMPAQVGGMTNVAWEVDDLQATFAALKAKGVQFTMEPKQQPWGTIQAMFADQDGNIMQLHQARK